MSATSMSPVLERRYARTMAFLNGAKPRPSAILDLGTPNLLSARMQAYGYDVQNTEGDLDENPVNLGGG